MMVFLYDRQMRCILAAGGALHDTGAKQSNLEGQQVEDFATPALLPHFRASG